MKNLAEKIKIAQNGDQNAMIEIITAFTPLINKYTRLLNYNEDCKSDLILKLIIIIKDEFNLDKMRQTNDGSIINYIKSSIKNHYIFLSKANSKINSHEKSYDSEDNFYIFESIQANSHEIDNYIIFETLKSVLTEREYFCIKSIVFEGKTAQTISKELNVSKQAVNQCKRRALNKIKHCFYNY